MIQSVSHYENCTLTGSRRPSPSRPSPSPSFQPIFSNIWRPTFPVLIGLKTNKIAYKKLHRFWHLLKRAIRGTGIPWLLKHTAKQIDVSFSCVCFVIDHEFSHNIVKVAVLSILWRNSLSITGQTHEKLTFICFLAITNCQKLSGLARWRIA